MFAHLAIDLFRISFRQCIENDAVHDVLAYAINDVVDGFVHSSIVSTLRTNTSTEILTMFPASK